MHSCGALKNIIDIITQKENKAVNILGGTANTNELKDYIFSKEETLTITHEDWGKLVNQFKYYSTRNDATRRFYEWLQRFYNLNKDTEFTREDYDLLKNTYNMLTHKDDGAAYVYSGIEWYYTDKDGKAGWKSNLAINAEASGEAGVMRYTKAYGYDGDTSEWTLTIGSVSGAISLKIS